MRKCLITLLRIIIPTRKISKQKRNEGGKGLTNKEIKQSARKNISQNMGNCVSLTAFLFAVFVFLGLCELALFMLFKRIGWEYFSRGRE